MSDDDKEKEKELLQLDQKSLEAIIEGVASTLRRECAQRNKPGEHSRNVSGSIVGAKGEILNQNTLSWVSQWTLSTRLDMK